MESRDAGLSSVLGTIIGKGIIAIANGALSGRTQSWEDAINQRIAQIDERINSLSGISTDDADVQAERDSDTLSQENVAIACLPCARAHFSTIAGTLKEALRFAREEGVMHPEVQSRLQTAEEDVTAVERHDWTPEKILQSHESEQKVIRRLLPKLRKLRQNIMTISSVEDLEKAAAMSGELASELRMEVLRLQGIDVNKLTSLAEKVQSGEISMEEAKEELMAQKGVI